MGRVAGPIPSLALHVLGIAADVNLAFDRHQIIRLDGQMGAPQRFQQAGKIASGVDDPARAVILQAADDALQGERNRRVLELGKKRPVEIG